MHRLGSADASLHVRSIYRQHSADSPSVEFQPLHWFIGLCVWASSRMEQEQYWSSLKHHLMDCQQSWSLSMSFRIHHTDWKVALPSRKSRVAKTSLDSFVLSPLVQLFASISHSGWN